MNIRPSRVHQLQENGATERNHSKLLSGKSTEHSLLADTVCGDKEALNTRLQPSCPSLVDETDPELLSQEPMRPEHVITV